MNKIFVTGIGTGVGKTIVSAILVEALKADYWKPIQAGNTNNPDTIKVKEIINNSVSKFHKESFFLSQPMSLHEAARIDNVKITLEKIIPPKTNNNLIIEGAGGIMVPLNDDCLLMIDLIEHLSADVILVSHNYLGSINHTLLTVETLKAKKLNILGIVFNGKENESTEDFILNYTKLKCLGKIRQEEIINKAVISKYVAKLETELNILI